MAKMKTKPYNVGKRTYHIPEDTIILERALGEGCRATLLAFRHPIAALPANHFLLIHGSKPPADIEEVGLELISEQLIVPEDELESVREGWRLQDRFSKAKSTEEKNRLAILWNEQNVLGAFHAMPLDEEVEWGFYVEEADDE